MSQLFADNEPFRKFTKNIVVRSEEHVASVPEIDRYTNTSTFIKNTTFTLYSQNFITFYMTYGLKKLEKYTRCHNYYHLRNQIHLLLKS